MSAVRQFIIWSTELPEILNVVLEPDYTAAVIEWETTELTDALVQFGESPFLSKTEYHPGPSFDHSLILAPLLPDRIYYYQVVSRDAAGNTVIDDNNGELYTFRTLTPVVPPWSDNLEGDSDWSVFDAEGSEASWQLGTPNNELANSAHSPTKAWGSNLQGGSSSLVETYLVSPAVELTGGNVATLRFWHNYDFTFESEFKLLEGGELQIYTNSLAQPIILRSYTDFTAGWEEVEVDLSPYIGNVVQFVWGYVLLDFTFEYFPYPGWLIDDVSVSVENVGRGTLRVTNNIADATFSITGPLEVEGGGRSYSNTQAPVGSYTCTFHPVPYYETPAPQTKELTTAAPVVFTGNYTFVDTNQNAMPDQWEQDWFEEYLAPILSIRIVDGLDQAIDHITRYGSQHTDAIVTENYTRARRFLREVDSSSVMVNTTTRFADGFEYGLGAEIGISTDKIHARGPVGLEGLTSQKFIVLGDGQLRQ